MKKILCFQKGSFSIIVLCLVIMKINSSVPLFSQTSNNTGNYIKNIVPNDIKKFDKFLDNKGNSVQIYAIAGLMSDPKAYQVTFQDNNSLKSYEKRMQCYKYVLKRIAIQEDFAITTLMNQNQQAGAKQNVDLVHSYLSTAVRTGQLSKEFLEIYGHFANLAYVKNTNELAKLKNIIKLQLRNLKHGNYANLSRGFSVLSLFLDSYQAFDDIFLKNLAEATLIGMQHDIIMQRLYGLQSLNYIDDYAYKDAMVELISEFETGNNNFWFDLEKGTISLIKIAKDILQLKYPSHPALGWAYAGIFAIQTYDMLSDWNDGLRYTACLATIYGFIWENKKNISDNYNVENLNFIQYEFWNIFSWLLNNNYMKFWEIFRPNQAETRIYFEKQRDLLHSLIINRRRGFLNIMVSTLPKKPDKVTIGFILDSSGSMHTNDPNDMRKTAVDQIIDLLDGKENILIVDFDSNAQWKNSGMWQKWNKSQLKDVIKNIDSNGGTNVGKGISEMRKAFEESSSENTNAAVMLLTDGLGKYNNEADWFIVNNIPVYTISFSNEADAALMDLIADQTEGVHVHVSSDGEIVSAFLQFYYELIGLSKLYSVNGTLTSDVFETEEFYVDNTSTEFICVLNWTGTKKNFVLVSPSGKKLDPAQMGQWYEGSTYKMIKINNPETGMWKAIIYQGNITVRNNLNLGSTFSYYSNVKSNMPNELIINYNSYSTDIYKTHGPNTSNLFFSNSKYTPIIQANGSFLFEASSNTKNKVNLEDGSTTPGLITYNLIDKSSNVDVQKSTAIVKIRTPKNNVLDMSNSYRAGKLQFRATEGKGCYVVQMQLEATDFQGNPVNRYFTRTSYIGDFVPGYIGSVNRILGNYIFTEQGSQSGNKAGYKCYIYSQGGSIDDLKAVGHVTNVSSNKCTIEIQQYFKPQKVNINDIVELDLFQWLSDD